MSSGGSNLACSPPAGELMTACSGTALSRFNCETRVPTDSLLGRLARLSPRTLRFSSNSTLLRSLNFESFVLLQSRVHPR